MNFTRPDSRPLVGVVLPFRDAATYLRPAVESLLRQTFANFEIVAVDDRSTDGGADLLRGFDDGRLRVIPSRGAGIVDALLTGLAATRAPYVARMDADDVARPERLARQLAFLDANSRISLVGTQVAHIDHEGRATGKISTLPTCPEDVAAALLARGCVIRHPTIMARAEVFSQIGTYRKVTEAAEDYDLWLRLSEKTQLANLPDVLLDYRIHSGQVSSGVNWRQRFAHDLAVISARARRRGDPDPLASFEAPIDWRDPAAADDQRLCAALSSLVLAYAAAEAMSADAATTPDPQALRAMIDTTRHNLFGDGRQLRGRTVARAAKKAIATGQWRLAMEAAHLAFETTPAKAASWLFLRHS